MNNDIQIQKISQLLAASRAGQIGIDESELLKIQKNYVAAKKLDGRRIKMIPAIILAVGLLLMGLSSLISLQDNPTQMHFEEYNQKLARGANTRIDDIRADAESKMLATHGEQSRPSELLFVFGVILCFVSPLVFLQLLRFKSMSAKEMKLVDEFAATFSQSGEGKSA